MEILALAEPFGLVWLAGAVGWAGSFCRKAWRFEGLAWDGKGGESGGVGRGSLVWCFLKWRRGGGGRRKGEGGSLGYRSGGRLLDC